MARRVCTTATLTLCLGLFVVAAAFEVVHPLTRAVRDPHHSHRQAVLEPVHQHDHHFCFQLEKVTPQLYATGAPRLLQLASVVERRTRIAIHRRESSRSLRGPPQA